MAAAASQPIGAHAFEQLCSTTLKAPVALAVSGGPDSMALMYMVARAMTDRAHGSVAVYTVDHRLRPDSASEANFVKAQATRLGFAHQTLTWQGDKPSSGLQETARAARYALMADAIRREHASGGQHRCLVTAHHADDQAETLLMRLARGSGASGLAGMRSRSELHGITILRPLLSVTKEQLIATLQSLGGQWVDDPSNTNADFERVRVRAAKPHLDALGFDSARLALSAQRLARADDALEALTDQLALNSSLSHHGGAFGSLYLAAFRSGSPEARIRLLGRLLASHGGDSEPARLSQLEALDDHIASSGDKDSATTLGGCALRWSAARGKLQVFREPGRFPLQEVLLSPGQSAVWDNRFVVSLQSHPQSASASDKGQIAVRALGSAAYATLRRTLKRDIPALAGAALPAFFQSSNLIAVPYFADQRPDLSGPEVGSTPICLVQTMK
jgi:tRNA(Ile)-lysidine synthase